MMPEKIQIEKQVDRLSETGGQGRPDTPVFRYQDQVEQDTEKGIGCDDFRYNLFLSEGEKSILHMKRQIGHGDRECQHS